MPAGHDTTIPDVTINDKPRQPVADPTLGIPVVVDRTGVPANRLVTIGDSLTHGFMSGAISRTDRSWPALVARELGLGTGFRYPTYEPPDGPGGLPVDIERLVRGLGDRVGDKVDWHEMVGALRWARRHLDRIEDYWERGDGTKVPTTPGPYHNLAVYGADLLDVLMLDADIVADRLAKEPPKDSFLVPQVDRDNDRAWRVVLESCRDRGGVARTVVEAAGAMGEEGVTRAPGDGGTSHGIETLVVVLGANHALGSVVRLNPKWTSAKYGALDETEKFARKGAYNVWQPAHFAEEWALVAAQLRTVRARHVILATVPQVTIAPIARGIGKRPKGSRYFPHYTRPWIDDDDFDVGHDQSITSDVARTIDSAIDAYNEAIIASVAAARRDGLDWYVFDMGGMLDSLAYRRYGSVPDSERPTWWQPYPLPPELAALRPAPPDTRFYRSGPDGRTQGGLISLDGVHPTTIGYGLVAHEVIRIMSTCAGVEFRAGDGSLRAAPGVDFGRLLPLDALASDPPAGFSSMLGLLGWLDEAVDWVDRVVPFR